MAEGEGLVTGGGADKDLHGPLKDLCQGVSQQGGVQEGWRDVPEVEALKDGVSDALVMWRDDLAAVPPVDLHSKHGTANVGHHGDCRRFL